MKSRTKQRCERLTVRVWPSTAAKLRNVALKKTSGNVSLLVRHYIIEGLKQENV